MGLVEEEYEKLGQSVRYMMMGVGAVALVLAATSKSTTAKEKDFKTKMWVFGGVFLGGGVLWQIFKK